jgi:2,4-dienoyl-CoA reductase (NADPH2)
MAAMVAAERGHHVTLFEASGEVGGQLKLARVVPGKEEFHGLVAWFKTMLDKHGVQVRLNTAASPADLAGFDETILATGVLPRDPGIPVTGGTQVLRYLDVLRGASVGRRVAIVGAGGIGFDVAEYLVQSGPSPALDVFHWRQEWGVVTPDDARGGLSAEGAQPDAPAREVWLLQRRAEKPGRGLGKTTGWIHRTRLQQRGVQMWGGVDYQAITDDGLMIMRNGQAELLAVDTVVLCVGQLPDRRLADDLTVLGRAFHLIGGADQAGELDARRAIDQGARLAARL